MFNLLQNDNRNDPAGTAYLTIIAGQEADRSTLVKQWIELRQCFLALQEWFKDREIRHAIGFLRWNKQSNGRFKLNFLWTKFKGEKRSNFRKWLAEQVQTLVVPPGRNLDSLSYDASSDKSILQDVLLWFNIHSLPKSADYPFAHHSGITTWSLEHIHAQNAAEVADDAQATLWLQGAIMSISEMKAKLPNIAPQTGSNIEVKHPLDVLTEKLAALPHTAKALEENQDLIRDFEALFRPIPAHEIDKLWNLALLGGDSNSALGKLFFHQKREKVFERERMGFFIPPATIRVFLKALGGDVSTMTIWTPKDRQKYREAIEQSINETQAMSSI